MKIDTELQRQKKTKKDGFDPEIEQILLLVIAILDFPGLALRPEGKLFFWPIQDELQTLLPASLDRLAQMEDNWEMQRIGLIQFWLSIPINQTLMRKWILSFNKCLRSFYKRTFFR